VTKPSAPRGAGSSSSRSKKSAAERTAAQGKAGTSTARTSAKPRPRHDRRGSNSRTARIIAVANQKGGVGKSTTAVSLGAALAELGHKVLVVDLDPQGNASTGLGIRHEARDVTVYDVLAAEAPIEGAIVPTQLANLFAIPSTIDLAGAEIELVSQFSREQRLRRAIEPLRQDAYDYVFLDCPPSLGLLTVNALAAAEELIVPIQCEYYALEGLGQLLRNVRLVQQNVNTGLRLTGIVLTMFDPRTKLSEQVVEEVRKYFGERVYGTIIPRTVRLSEAPGYGLPITSYDPTSKGAEAYRQLAREVHNRPPDESPLPVMEDVPAVVVPPPEPMAARAPRPLVDPDAPSNPGEEDEEPSAEAVDEPGDARGIHGAEVTLDARSSPASAVSSSTEDDGSRAGDEVEPVSVTMDRETSSGANGEAEPEDSSLRSEVEVAPVEPELSEPVPADDPVPDEEETPDRAEQGTGKRLRGLFRRGGRS
jgi:chromosome partitioning protein